ncbi:MAG TPA: universal stress protein [Gemmataceae bacterium]|nr:universal stress protein [Gemmataceae bacterium]
MLKIQSILHPTDFSAVSYNAFQMACHLAQDYGAALHIVHVSTTFEAFQGERVWNEHPTQYLEHAWKNLQKLEWPGIVTHRYLEEGDAAEQIVALAQRLNCEIIVMGSHGRSGLNRLLVGSVAEQVIREAHCQILIAKAAVATTPDVRPAQSDMHKIG